MKIIKIMLFITLLILLAGFVNASEVSEDISDTDIISEELVVKDTDALLDKEVGADLQADNEYNVYESAENTLKMNNDNDELKENPKITNWFTLSLAAAYTKYQKGNITLTLEKGTYKTTGTITFNNPDAVITINGNGQTIDGNKKQVFNIAKGSSVVLENITINNGLSKVGGAIVNYGTLTVIQSTFTKNTAKEGIREGTGGAIANYGTLTVKQSTFTQNTADTVLGHGGAIYSKGKLNIAQSTFTNNKAAMGGAIYNDDKLNITQSTFTQNTADDTTGGGRGGAIINYGTATVKQSTFTKNTAGRGYGGASGGAIGDQGHLTVIESTFTGNKAAYRGGAIYNQAGSCKVIRSNFTSNRAKEGAAIDSFGGTNITGNRFTDNHADRTNETIDQNGHKNGVYDANAYKSTEISLKTMKLELEDNKKVYYNGEKVTLNFNMALDHPENYDKDVFKRLEDITLYINGVKYGTAKYPNCTLNLKPGEYEAYYKTCQYTSNTVKFTVKSITNWQELTDAVDHAKNQKKDVNLVLGEGTYINTGTINWTNKNIVLTIDGNGQTIDGNQQLVFDNRGGCTLVLKNVTIKDAKSANGAIYSLGTLKVVGATLVNNTATAHGGAISCYGILTLINSTLVNNTATKNGGAIMSAYSHVDIINSNFTNNHAANGGAIFSYGNCNITGNIFTNNTAKNRETIDLYGYSDGNVNSNTYESTDISLKTIKLMVKDNQTIFDSGEEVVLNYTIALKNPTHYDRDILQRLEDITVYINGVENATTKYENYTLSNLKPGEYTVYYKAFNQKSNNVSFKIIDFKEIILSTWDIEMVQAKTATFSAIIDYKNTAVNYGNVYFEIDGKPLVDKKGSILYAAVENNEADLSYPTPINLPVGNHTITAVYVYGNRILATDNKTLTIIEDIPEGSGDDGEIPYEDDKKQETYTGSVLKYSPVNFNSASKTYTVTSASDNQLICESHLFILEYLNKLFNMNFINGHIKVYIDSKLVFEGDTTDDLTQVIFEIMDDYLGEHEITVEFTDSEGKSSNYKEKIIVE